MKAMVPNADSGVVQINLGRELKLPADLYIVL